MFANLGERFWRIKKRKIFIAVKLIVVNVFVFFTIMLGEICQVPCKNSETNNFAREARYNNVRM